LDLCELLGQPKPAAADPVGAWYCFDAASPKWKAKKLGRCLDAGHFGWEYKGKHKDLVAASSNCFNIASRWKSSAAFISL